MIIQKNMNFLSIKHIFLFFFISFSLINKESSSFLSLKNIEKFCSNSDKFINNYFNGIGVLPDNYNELDENEIEKGNDEKIIKLILLTEDSQLEYEKAKISKFKIYQLILLVFMIPLCVITIIIFEIHFLCRTTYIAKENKKKNAVTCSTFIRINPFGFFKYSCMNQKERIDYFIEYKSKKMLHNRYSVIFFSIVIFILMTSSIFIAVLKFFVCNKIKSSVDNMTCSLMKFLYEIKIKPIRQSSFIGFENVTNFFANFSKSTKIINEKFMTLKNNSNECKILNTSWISSINKIQENLSNEKSMEFFLYGIPSMADNINFRDTSTTDDFSKVEKHLFQLEAIYNFYPVNIEGTTLYYINKFFNDLSEPIMTELESLLKKLSSQESNNKDNENINIYQNVVSKFDNVLNLYIKKFQDIYIEKIDKNLKNDLTDIYNFDLILVFVLIFCITLSIILIKNVFNQNCYSYNGMISISLMHLIFIFFILSTYQLIIFQNINKKITYIQDIWRGIAFLFDSNNINYLNEHPIDYIGDIDILIKEDNKYNNLFYYLNLIVNNQGKLNNNSDFEISLFTNAELSKVSKTFNNFNNTLISYDDNKPNEYLYNYTLKIIDMIEGGLEHDTAFQDLSDSGLLTDYYEDPLRYLSNVNLRTRANTRTAPVNGFKDFDCDETWNISTINFAKWAYNKYYIWYYTNSDKYLCDSCTNHYSGVDSTRPPLLNFVEFTLEQILQRYSDLKGTENYAEYNALVYYFTGVEFLRNSSFIEHLQKMNDFNIELSDIQNNNFYLLKKNVNSAKEIINEYLNLLNYTGGDLSSAIYCKFLRQNLNFVLGVIKSGFLKKINNINIFHILLNIVNIILSIFMIIFYCLISYNLSSSQAENSKNRNNNQDNRSSIKKIIKEKKKVGSLISYDKGAKNQIISNITKNNIKEGNSRQIIINITGNNIGHNIYLREQDNGIKKENYNFNSQINDNNNKLVDNTLKNEVVQKNSPVQNEGLGDYYDVDFQSKANIIGELQNNDAILKLNNNN